MSKEKQKWRPVLVAESDIVRARLLVATIQQAGRAAIVAQNGDEVLRMLEKYSPDVLLLNMNFARPSGPELLRTINARANQTRVIALTTQGQADLRSTAAGLGVEEFVEVPFLPSDLASRVS